MKDVVVDIDGHVAEPITQIMDEYLEFEFKDRPLRLLNDEKGLEYLEINGKKSVMVQGGAGLGVDAGKAFGAEDFLPFFTPGEVHYYDGMIPEANEPDARARWHDGEGVDKALLYPSLGLSWEDECDDPSVAAAYCRAYNNWLLDFCKSHPDRHYPIAHIPTRDTEEAVAEVRRTARLGVKGFMVYSTATNGLYYGNRYFDPLYDAVQQTGLPFAIHPTTHVDYLGKDNYRRDGGTSGNLSDDFYYLTVVIPFQTQLALIHMISEGAFDRFPHLKYVLLETGATWIAYWLERLDEKLESEGHSTTFKEKPSDYFQRQCWISLEPEEELIPFVVQKVGADKFFWATDFPHHDGFPGVVGRIRELLKSLPAENVRKIMGQNGLEVYDLR